MAQEEAAANQPPSLLIISGIPTSTQTTMGDATVFAQFQKGEASGTSSIDYLDGIADAEFDFYDTKTSEPVNPTYYQYYYNAYTGGSTNQASPAPAEQQSGSDTKMAFIGRHVAVHDERMAQRSAHGNAPQRQASSAGRAFHPAAGDVHEHHARLAALIAGGVTRDDLRTDFAAASRAGSSHVPLHLRQDEGIARHDAISGMQHERQASVVPGGAHPHYSVTHTSSADTLQGLHTT